LIVGKWGRLIANSLPAFVQSGSDPPNGSLSEDVLNLVTSFSGEPCRDLSLVLRQS
jgi:hypothetical protein